MPVSPDLAKYSQSNPYDYGNRTDEHKTFYKVLTDKEFLSDITSCCLYFLAKIPDEEKLNLTEICGASIVAIGMKANQYLCDILNDSTLINLTDKKGNANPTNIVAESIIQNTFNQVPELWNKLDKSEQIIIGTIAALRIIGQGYPMFGILQISDYLEREQLDPKILRFYEQALILAVKTRLGSSNDLSEFSYQLVNRFLPRKKEISTIIDRYSLGIELSCGSYKRIKAHDIKNFRRLFGYSYQTVMLFLHDQKSKKFRTIKDLIYTAEEKAGLFVPEIALKSPQKLIKALAIKFDELGLTELPPLSDRELFYQLFGFHPHKISWQSETKKWNMNVRDILNKALEKSLHQKKLSYRDYEKFTSLNECLKVMASLIRELKNSYVSPSLHHPENFKKIFGITHQDLREIAIRKNWNITVAQIRNRAEIMAEVRKKTVDYYLKKNTALNYMAKTIKELGVKYKRPRITNIQEFKFIFGISPRTLSGRIYEKKWALSLLELVIEAEKKAKVDLPYRRSLKKITYHRVRTHLIERIIKLGRNYRRPNLAKRKDFFDVYHIQYTTLMRNMKKQEWPIQTVVELLDSIEDELGSNN